MSGTGTIKIPWFMAGNENGILITIEAGCAFSNKLRHITTEVCSNVFLLNHIKYLHSISTLYSLCIYNNAAIHDFNVHSYLTSIPPKHQNFPSVPELLNNRFSSLFNFIFMYLLISVVWGLGKCKSWDPENAAWKRAFWRLHEESFHERCMCIKSWGHDYVSKQKWRLVFSCFWKGFKNISVISVPLY